MHFCNKIQTRKGAGLMSDNILNGNLQTLKDILARWEEHEKTVGEVELLMSRIRGLNRDIDAMDKKTKGLADAAVKKRKDELISGIDKAIAKETDKLKKAKADRDKAFAKGKAQRIKDDTEALRKDNERLKSELKGIMRANKILPFCRSRFFLALFATKGLVEIIIFIISFLVAACVLPYFVFWLLPTDKPFVLAVIYSVFWTVISFIYMFINNRVKLNKWDVFKSIRLYKFKIEQNTKHIHKIKGEISKDTDEGAYDLNEFNARINEADKLLNDLNKQREAALAEFEKETKPSIIAEIEAPVKDERERLAKELEDAKKELADKEEKEKADKAVLAGYESYLDKKLINRESLSALIRIIEEGSADSVSQAVNVYREADKK